MIIANDQPRVSAIESIFGGWAMLSPEFQELVQELMLGYGLAGIGIILIIVAVIQSKSEEKEDDHEREIEDGAIDILEKRYAKGEITKDKFDKMKKDLE